MSIPFNYDDQSHFKSWLGLNLHSISWEGRYQKEFEEFWNLLFPANIELEDQFRKIDHIRSFLVKGPLIAWMNWLKTKLICYLFIHKNYSLRELTTLTKISVREISLELRNFMIERYPYLEEGLNDRFQIGNELSRNIDLRFLDLQKLFDFDDIPAGSEEGEVLTSLEVTLYQDWQRAYSILKGGDKKYMPEQNHFLVGVRKNKRRVLLEVLALFVLAVLVIFSIKSVNKFYEDYLVEKISLYSPDFFWLDKNISFMPDFELGSSEFEIKYNELEELEKIESRQVFRDVSSSQRYEVESDVVLTSVDTLPKDFTSANLEQSDYEEVKKGGYRNVRYGRRKAYRVMMTSVDPTKTKEELAVLLKKYSVTQVDNVKPGTSIPGGIYFNLFVPTTHLKEFLSKVTAREQNATILESKTIYGGPSGRNRVFIWVKSI
ncbi:MAG: hypothetical protein CME65_09040 [Halobacteriovoraceae bacterium]|nr:hypothetical protein [Halobacteriovoraceae bacterium]